jgi:hypothetical protein
MNFSNSDETTVPVQVSHLNVVTTANAAIQNHKSAAPPAVEYLLGATSGTTTLFSADLSPQQAGGPKKEVAWSRREIPAENLSSFDLTIPAASLVVVIFGGQMI